MVAAILSYLVDEAFMDLFGKYMSPDEMIAQNALAYRQRHFSEPLQKLIELASRRGTF